MDLECASHGLPQGRLRSPLRGLQPRQAQRSAGLEKVGALSFAFAILSAIVSRQRTGRGQYFETSQLGAMCEYQANGTGLATTLKTGRMRDDGKPPFYTNPTQTYYKCSDGKWFAIGYVVQKFWEATVKDLIREELQRHFLTAPRQEWLDRLWSVGVVAGPANGYVDVAAEPHFWENGYLAELDLIKEELQRHFLTAPRQEWLDRLWSAGVVAGPVNSYVDVAAEPHFWENGYLAEVEHPHLPALGKIRVQGKAIRYHGTPAGPVASGELLGESTEPVLRELGFSEEELAGLRAAGAIQRGVGAAFTDKESYPAPPRSKL